MCFNSVKHLITGFYSVGNVLHETLLHSFNIQQLQCWSQRFLFPLGVKRLNRVEERDSSKGEG